MRTRARLYGREISSDRSSSNQTDLRTPHAAVHVLHVIETDVLAGEDTADLESTEHAQALLDACVAELSEVGVPVTGELLHSYGTHTDVAAQILHRATDLGAGAIVLGAETRHAAASSVNAYVAAHAPSHVIIVNPAAGALGRPSAGGPLGDPSVGAGLVRLSRFSTLQKPWFT